MATVGQGKGRQGAGTARARCGVLRLAPGAAPPFLPSLRSGRRGRRSQQLPGFLGSGQRVSGKGCPERKPAIPPARLSVRHGGCEPACSERGRAQGSCLTAERRCLGHSDRQLFLCCRGASPAHPESFRPAYSFSSWGLCRTSFPSTSPKCSVASMAPPCGAPPDFRWLPPVSDFAEKMRGNP